MEPKKKSPRSSLPLAASASPARREARPLLPIRRAAILGLAAAAASLLACGSAQPTAAQNPGCANPHLTPGSNTPALPGGMVAPTNATQGPNGPIEPARNPPPPPGEPPAIMAPAPTQAKAAGS